MDGQTEHDCSGCRFTLTVDGEAGGYLTYEIRDGCLDIQHTVVDIAFRGNGFGGVLIRAAVDYAEKNGLSVKPTCSYAKKLLKEAP
ncbi:MAG: N-acetyltransferase [Candidatus Methanoplasma sp.]|nr:N-acetyltransferase [Candidatus Methanoplasma sp.]